MSHFQSQSPPKDIQLESTYTALFFELLWMKKLMSSVSNAKLIVMKQRLEFFLHTARSLEVISKIKYLKSHGYNHAFTRGVKKTKV